MKYRELINYYQGELLAEKDLRGFDGIKKMSRANTKHMNVSTKYDSGRLRGYHPYYDMGLSTAAVIMMRRLEKLPKGQKIFVPDNIGLEITSKYDIALSNTPKKLNSKGDIAIMRQEDGKIYILKI